MKVKVLFCGIAIFFSQCLTAQHKLTSYLEFYDAQYTFEGQSPAAKTVDRHFPAYDVFEKDLTTGYKLKLRKGKNQLRYAQIALGDITLKLEEQTTLYLRSYTENVAALSISLYDHTEAQWKTFTAELPTQGLQEPVHFPINQFGPAAEGIALKDPNYLYLHCKAQNPKKPINLEIGALMIGKYYMEGIPVVNDFFEGIVEDVADSVATLASRSVMLDEFLLPMNLDYMSTPSNLALTTTDNNAREPKLVYDVLQRTFERYLFYEETGIESSSVLSNFASQFEQRMHTAENLDCALVNDLADFVENTFQDPHFGIKRGPCTRPGDVKLSRGPIRLYEFGQRVQVAAVLSPTYQESIQLGDEILSVDGEPIGELIERNSHALGPWERRTDIISNLLKRAKQDSVLLGIKGKAEPVMVHYNAPMKIPANFRYKHCEYRDIDESTAYFRVKTWTLDVYFEFNRYWQQIKDKKHLILDLRSNTGGEFLSALRLMTVFLGKPIERFRMVQHNQRYESFVAQPNPNVQFPTSSKVIILVDAKTACTSESFILGMKKMPNVTLIGQDKTYGTDGSRNDIVFPSGFSIYINAIAKKNIYPNDFILETKGINPDIWVYPQEVQDLRPYNDKVLQSALELIKNNSF